MRHILMPQHCASQRISYDHKTKVPAPISCIHLYGDFLIRGYLIDIPHPLQITPYGLLIYTVLDSKLFQCLLAFYIVRDNL